MEELLDAEYRQPSNDRIIGIYWPLADEVDLRPLRQQGPVALPVADGHGGLVYRRWGCDGATSQILQPDGCGIPAPSAGRTLQPEELACLLVPALAIDHRGVRLGYGGGYYDRLRQQAPWRAVRALVVLPSACITDAPLPQDPWDIADGLISEKDLVVPQDRRIMTSPAVRLPCVPSPSRRFQRRVSPRASPHQGRLTRSNPPWSISTAIRTIRLFHGESPAARWHEPIRWNAKLELGRTDADGQVGLISRLSKTVATTFRWTEVLGTGLSGHPGPEGTRPSG